MKFCGKKSIFKEIVFYHLEATESLCSNVKTYFCLKLFFLVA